MFVSNCALEVAEASHDDERYKQKSDMVAKIRMGRLFFCHFRCFEADHSIGGGCMKSIGVRMLLRGLLFFVFLAGMVLGCMSFDTGITRHEARVYEGVGEGYRGPIHVSLRIGSGGIVGIEIIDHAEDELVGGMAMEELLDVVLTANSTDVDGVSGATESSAGFLAAIDDALRKAQTTP